MPAKTGSRNGLKFGWALGENNWNVGMDDNLKFLDRFGVQLSFKSFLNTPPSTLSAGDSYVVGPAPTGVWAGKANQVAVYDQGAWAYGTPRTGWQGYCEADGTMYVFDTSWVASSGGGGPSLPIDISDVTGLQTALDDKVDDTDPRLSDARTPLTHMHAQSDVTGLATALSGKQDTLVSGVNIKTINSTSLLGSGNIDVSGGSIPTDPSFDSLQLTGGTGDQGKMTWNPDEETVDLIQNGSTLQIG